MEGFDHSRVEQVNGSTHPYGSESIAMPPPLLVGFIRFHSLFAHL